MQDTYSTDPKQGNMSEIMRTVWLSPGNASEIIQIIRDNTAPTDPTNHIHHRCQRYHTDRADHPDHTDHTDHTDEG